MIKIYDISDYVKKSRVTINQFNGKIAVDENGWFEGYLKERKSISYDMKDKYYFIFGIYHKDELLDLYRCSNGEPEVFRGELDNKRFLGKFKIIGEKENREIHKLYFKESEVKNSKIHEKITNLKANLIGICPDFYNRVHVARKELNDVLVKSYVGIKFTDEDRLKAREINNQKRLARDAIRKYY